MFVWSFIHAKRSAILGVALAMPWFFTSFALTTSPDQMQLTEAPKTATSSDSPRIPIRNFFRNPVSTYFLLSPDGDHIAFLQPYKSRLNLFVIDKKDLNQGLSAARRLTSFTFRDIQHVIWKGNSTLLFMRDLGGDENYHIYAVDIGDERVRDLTPYKGVRAQIVDSLGHLNDTHILVGLNLRNREVFDLHRVNVKTGELVLEARNPGWFVRWLVDHAGQVRGAMAFDGVTREFYSLNPKTQKFIKTFATGYRVQIEPMVFTPDNQNLYAISNLGRDKSAVVVFDIKTGLEIETIYERDDVDVSWIEYSEYRKALSEVEYVTWKREFRFFDDQRAAVYQALSEKFPGLLISLRSSNDRETQFTLIVHSDQSPGTYYFYDHETGEILKLSDTNPSLQASQLAPMKPIEYISRDGLLIHGYLTLPLSYKPGEKLPFVIKPHGGPWDRDIWDFHPEIQMLANRGFGVLQMNFRGSTGYGRKFWEASFKEWGRKMQNDITDGVHWLIEEGFADPKRIGIFGKSYGGYAVLAGLAFTPDLYACGVDYAGVSNLFTLLASVPAYWKPELEMIYDQIGHPEKDRELLKAISPVFHADRIKAPLMVVQGAKDPRVKVQEAEQIVRALRDRGIEVPYLLKANEGHGFLNEENRIEFYEKLEAFLLKHLRQPES